MYEFIVLVTLQELHGERVSCELARARTFKRTSSYGRYPLPNLQNIIAINKTKQNELKSSKKNCFITSSESSKPDHQLQATNGRGSPQKHQHER